MNDLESPNNIRSQEEVEHAMNVLIDHFKSNVGEVKPHSQVFSHIYDGSTFKYTPLKRKKEEDGTTGMHEFVEKMYENVYDHASQSHRTRGSLRALNPYFNPVHGSTVVLDCEEEEECEGSNEYESEEEEEGLPAPTKRRRATKARKRTRR